MNRSDRGVSPPSSDSVDACGRLRVRSESERLTHSAALREALDDIDAIGQDASDTPEIWAEVFRGIDAARPHRPLLQDRP